MNREDIVQILNKYAVDLFAHGLRYGYETNTPLLEKIADEIVSLPPAEGAEKQYPYCPTCGDTIEHGEDYGGYCCTKCRDGHNNDLAAQQQPTAEGAEVDVLFKARRLDTGDWVTGFFTKKKIGNLICPVIEVYKEWDSGDYIESYEIDGKTLVSLHAQRIAEKMAEKNWININDRMPESGFCVLLYSESGGVAEGACTKP